MRILWDDPWFKDNSGEYPYVSVSHANGHLFKIGQHLVSREIPCYYLQHLDLYSLCMKTVVLA